MALLRSPIVRSIRMVLLVVLVVSAGSTFSTPALARTPFALGARIGTLGYGLEASVRLGQPVHLRGMAHTYSYEDTDTTEGIRYEAELDLQTIGVVVDWYAFGGGFHLTGGLFVNDNEITGDGRPDADDTYEIGEGIYTAEEVGQLRAEVAFDEVSPYLGIGWGQPFRDARWTFRAELGALLQGSPETSLTSTREDEVPGLSADLERERREFEEDAEEYDFWPVLSLGVTYRF